MSQGTFSVALDHVTNGAVLVAAVTGYRYEILEFLLTADATDRIKIREGSTVLVALEVTAGGGGIKSTNGYPLTDFTNGLSQNLNLVTVGAANVSGFITYRQIPVTAGV